MIKRILKVLVPVLVFLATFTGASALTDKESGYITSEMPGPTLPIVYLQKEDRVIDQLFGYRGQMEEENMRGNIMPLSADMTVDLTVQTFQNHVEGISYEVRTMDNQRLLESTQVADYNETDGIISTQLKIQNLLQPDAEYRLILILTCDGEELRYYSRLFRTDSCYVEESLDFVQSFHQKAISGEDTASLATYLEPNAEGDNTTLQRVTIHSNLKQVAWADMEGQVLKEPIPLIQELGANYNTIILKYVYASNGEDGETKFYNVEEYFRLRYSTVSNRIHLLDYERTMNEIFQGDSGSFDKASIRMGIRDGDISYMTNEPGSYISFIQEGDLWNYSCSTNQLSRVFSFRGMEGINDRENHQEYDIRIIKMDETGSTDFVVYGYMNRGEHEGYSGICVYHYDAVANTVQEEVFVESSQPYQVLKQTWGRLFYVSGDGDFYMAAEGTLYRINLADGSVRTIQRDLETDSLAVAAGGRYVAWQGEDPGLITVMDLEDKKKWEVEGEQGASLRPIGFVESDFVYGIANEARNGSSLLYKIVIVDQTGQQVKEYEKPELFITNAYVEKNSVVLERAYKNGELYVETAGDTIKSREIEAAQSIQVNTVYDAVRQTQMELALPQELARRTLQLLTPKEVVAEEKNLVTLEPGELGECYYVYYGDDIVRCMADVSDAVRYADEIGGSVTGRHHQYIWRRGREGSKTIRTEELPFDISVLSGSQGNQREILQSVMDKALVLNLNGCAVSQILYYIDQGSPVLSYDSEGQPVLIVGYDQYNVLLYDFAAETTYRKGLQDSQDFFNQAGSLFTSYLPE